MFVSIKTNNAIDKVYDDYETIYSKFCKTAEARTAERYSLNAVPSTWTRRSVTT